MAPTRADCDAKMAELLQAKAEALAEIEQLHKDVAAADEAVDNWLELRHLV